MSNDEYSECEECGSDKCDFVAEELQELCCFDQIRIVQNINESDFCSSCDSQVLNLAYFEEYSIYPVREYAFDD